jgi:hypothetical protein
MTKKTNKKYSNKKNLKKRTQRNNKKLYGGIFSTTKSDTSSSNTSSRPRSPSITDEGEITNGEIIAFTLFSFIPETGKSSFISIIDNNLDFVNNIHEEIKNNTLNFSTNESYRKFINDLGQWILFDYNPQFSTCMFQILYDTISDNNFLNDKVDIDTQYNILLKNVKQMIVRKEEENDKLDYQDVIFIQNDRIISLLRIFLRMLNIPENKKGIMEGISSQNTTINSYKRSILCILKHLIETKALQKDNVRILIGNLIKDMTIKNNLSNWTTIVKNGSELIGNCGSTIATNAVSNVVSSSFSKYLGR